MQKRILSVDILRGLTIAAMILVNTPGTWSAVYAPLLHAEWNGLTPTDLVFPFFLFIVGVSISIAYQNTSPYKKTILKIVSRSLKLVALGLFLAVFLPYFPFFKSIETLRFPGVLQRIGIVFFVTALIYLYTNTKKQLLIFTLLLVISFVWMGYIPLPNGHLPTFDRSPDNWSNYLDVLIFGKHTWKADYDPEGLLSTLGAVATCIFGVLMGKLLLKNRTREMMVIAVGALIIGYIWNLIYPIGKANWSSSFVLVTGGYAALLLIAMYQLYDVGNFKWGTAFKYFGVNPIVLYFASSFISKCFYLIELPLEGNPTIHGYLYQSIYVQEFFPEKLSSLLYALTVVAFYFLLGYVLYKKKIFIKI
ncbi:MAG: heparan-alpha-glucosaminide N-acetyltransferase domain-containing protein [Flavobacteriaceae bacterium]|nr:heparan-alpha-glucosaminide N-acetyltransferase domain-containing protein [Flavobacteriaceae bacterium]MDZ4149083.1 heparan-alpha-glucosaminide N-acetyltransferase domain-containing protein [Flavobacteriaceae bacterium]